MESRVGDSQDLGQWICTSLMLMLAMIGSNVCERTHAGNGSGVAASARCSLGDGLGCSSGTAATDGLSDGLRIVEGRVGGG